MDHRLSVAAGRIAITDRMHIAQPGAVSAAGQSQLLPQAAGDIPGDASTTTVLHVQEGESIHSDLSTQADSDWFAVTLSAGEDYDFTLSPDNTDATLGPDLKLGVYDASGTLVTESDSGSFGGEEHLKFHAAADGAYYVGVSSYASAGVNIGYTVTGAINNDPAGNGGTPLAAIDWGTRVDTDGQTDADGNELIQVYYAKSTDLFFGSPTDPIVPLDWDAYAKDDTKVAFQQYEHIVNVRFQEVTDRNQADFVLVETATAPVLLGQMRPPGEENEGIGDFNRAGIGWSEDSLRQGGYSFITFIHEFGHGMGLAHPHDNGGSSEVMHGVTGDTASGYTTGDYGLNQGVYTTMTYNDGWQDGPNGGSDSDNYGYQGTLMALDVAVLQQKYGANTAYHTGDDVYTLPDQNAAGTMYACIWDAGGVDTISAGDAVNAHIDLRSATLKYERGGGGWVSYSDGIYGGYTVAHGVVVENATGGVGDDLLSGNNTANTILGLAGGDLELGRNGDDLLFGGAGRDKLYGGGGADQLCGGAGRDVLAGGRGADIFVFTSDDAGGADRIVGLTGEDRINLKAIDARESVDGNQAFRLVDAFTGREGQAVLSYDSGHDRTSLLLDTDGDAKADYRFVMSGDHSDFSNFVL